MERDGPDPANKKHPAIKPLRPGHVAFCEWLANHGDDLPPISEQLEKLRECVQKHVGVRALRSLKKRAEFREMFSKLQNDVLKRTREKLNRNAHRAADTIVKANNVINEMLDEDDRGLLLAAARLAPSVTAPVLDRAYPRKENIAVANVEIKLSPAQQAILEDGTCEVLEAEVVDTDD